MEEIKVELERARLKNYVLQKENEILLGTIGMMAKEKKAMNDELEKHRKTISYKIKRRSKDIIKTIIGKK